MLTEYHPSHRLPIARESAFAASDMLRSCTGGLGDEGTAGDTLILSKPPRTAREGRCYCGPPAEPSTPSPPGEPGGVRLPPATRGTVSPDVPRARRSASPSLGMPAWMSV